MTLLTAAELSSRENTYKRRADFLAAIKDASEAHYSEASRLARGAEMAGRKMLASEQRKWDQHVAEMEKLGQMFEDNQVDYSQVIETDTGWHDGAGRGYVTGSADSDTGRVLSRGQSVADWARRNGGYQSRQADADLSLGKLLRGWVTSRWDGAEAEQRALLEGTQAGGGVLVPTPLSAQIIDRARNQSRCFQAGASIVPMDSQTLTVPRISGSPNPAWRAENAQIAEGDLTFDSVTFVAKSMALIVKCSRELIEDGQDVDGVVARDLAAQVAVELDRVLLRGTGTGAEPCGVRNTSGVTVTAFGGVNGAAPTNYDFLLDAVQSVRAGNFEPNGVILAPRTETTLSKLKTTDGAYLAPPSQLATLPRYSTNQIPQNLTTGTSSDTTEVYVGDWSHLWLGMRTGFTLTTLDQRYADYGQVAFLVWMRADVQLSQPGAFNVIAGVR